MCPRPASALACVLLAAAFARAQSDTLPPLPPPPPQIANAPTPLAYQPPPPPPSSPLAPPPPGGACSTPDGFFANVELAVVIPEIKSKVPNGGAGLLRVPEGSLATTLSPKVEFGYRLKDDQGYFAASYRFLQANGSGDPHSRLRVNTIDLDYGVLPYEFSPRWTLGWRLGARIDDLVLDARNIAGQRSRHEFYGGGLHTRAELERRIVPVPGLSLFGRLDGAVVIGHVNQRYTDANYSTANRDTRSVPVINVQAGLSYVPPALPRFKITGGYEYEQYFDVGSLGLTQTGAFATSSGDVSWHGFFLRGQLDF